MTTLANILQEIGAIVDQDTTSANSSGTDQTVRVSLINQSLREWGNAYQWNQLRFNSYYPSIALSMTSMALPTNFKKLMSRPFRGDLVTDNDYEEIRPEDRFQKLTLDVNNRFCYVGGDESVGKYLVINPPLPSGASLTFDYQMFPSSMATLQDVCVCPQPGYLTKRVISKIFESRADPRFPTFKAEADDSLATMMEEEGALSGAFTNRTPYQFDKYNFRLGQD